MKKLFSLLLFIIGMTISINAQVETSCWFDGFWSDWKKVDSSVSLYGSWESFIMYDSESGGKWNPQFKITISNFSVPKKKQRKKDIKVEHWYEFQGTVEYYLPDASNQDNKPMTLHDLFKQVKYAYFKDETFYNNSGKEFGRKARKIISNAKIKIAPFEKQPSTYNISFDNVGVAFSIKAPNWKTFDE